jgi:outer membrane usher protein
MRPRSPAEAASAAGKAAFILACLPWCAGDAALALPNEAGVGNDSGSYLPAFISAKEDLFLAVFLNDYDMQKLAAFHRFADGCMTIAPEDLKEFNLKIPDAAMHASGVVCLEKLPGVTYRYDVNAQNIHLKVSDDARVPLEFDAHRTRPDPTVGQDWSAVFNYALFASGGSQDISTNTYPQYQGVSATVDGHVFSHYGAFNQSFTANSTATELTPNFIRLDSRWFYEDPETLVTYSAGDVISGSLNWSTSIRMGGLQVRRDFQLRPDLITQPMQQFSGSAAVPSTVEVFANQARTFSQASRAARSISTTFRSPPDRGRCASCCVTLPVRITEYAYYNSTTLIAPGLFDYSVEAGFARQFYGLTSDGYDGNPIGSASFRYGVTPRITMEGHAEGGAGLANAGGGVDFGLWHYGVASLAVSGSEYDGALGGQAYASFETSLWGARFMARAMQALREYQDLASVTAPKCGLLIAGCASGIGAVYKRQDQVSLSVPLYFDDSFINASYTDSLDYDGNAGKVGTVSYSRPFYWDHSTISLNVFNDFEQKNNYGAYAAVTYSWGKSTSSAIAEASNSAYGAGGSFSRSLGQEPGSYGYSVTALEGPQPYNAASAAYRAAAFQASAGIIETGKSAQATAQVDGAVAVLNGVHFANRIDNSCAVVDTECSRAL